jgi:hypothetical protein
MVTEGVKGTKAGGGVGAFASGNMPDKKDPF